MKKRLLVWGALAVTALGVSGCSYCTTTHHHYYPHGMRIGKAAPMNCAPVNCPADNDCVGTWTVETVEVVPVGQPAPAPTAAKAAAKTAKQQCAPATPAASAVHATAPAAGSTQQ